MEIIRSKKIIAVMILMVMIISMTCPVFAAGKTNKLTDVGNVFISIWNVIKPILETIWTFITGLFTNKSTNVISNIKFSAPLKSVDSEDITQKFGNGHIGLDIKKDSGTAIYAAKAGKVVTSEARKNSKGNYTSYGEYIVIEHDDGTKTLYAHGSKDSRKVTTGQTVVKGQHIMNVGSTGNSTGPHLHFEIIENGKCVNPQNYVYSNL